ncbi:MAG TPA: UDP-N-acetylmuramoyl-L-alanyl-D-glutamate--2,6-diaminopimelate ligase [Patescibacteria group bacterium]
MFDYLLYKLKRPYHLVKTGLFQGLPAQVTTGFPARKLTIIALTGTDGKTTSSTLLYHILKSAGKKVALISTVAAYIGDERIDTGFHVTSPDPGQLHRLLRRMVKEGIEYVVLETTSHGIYQYRTWGITPTIAGVTNITHEHLDYHLSYDEYVKAKVLLLNKSKKVVLNRDDESFTHIKKHLRKKASVLTYSSTQRLHPHVAQSISQRFSQPYNQMNARLVYTISKELGLTAEEFSQALPTFPGVPGRMEEVKLGQPYKVVVDFAHTPQALESTLKTLRSELSKQGKLIAVYGCAGLRDHLKRPIMGRIGSELADIAVFTAEDPRTENVWDIIRQMKEGLVDTHNKVASIPSRRAAIEFALATAKKGDTVAILGKGHEQSMGFGTTEVPWNDTQVVTELLA